MRAINPGNGAILQAVYKPTPAQLAAGLLAGTTALASPGPNTVIVPLAWSFVYKFNNFAYFTTTNDNLTFQYQTPGAPNLYATQVSSLVIAAASEYAFRLPSTTLANVLLAADAQGLPLQIQGGTYNAGPILTTTLNAGGSGYAVNDTGTITTGSADATYIVTSIGAGGAVTGYTITSGGTHYPPATAVATATGGAQPGVGTGFKVNIVTVQIGDGSLEITIFYGIVQVT